MPKKEMNLKSKMLISWVAYNNDPYERDRITREYIKKDKQKVPGPTLTLLFDEASEYNNNISNVVLFYRRKKNDFSNQDNRVVEETTQAISKHDKAIKITPIPWIYDDPTDHKAIFQFLKNTIPSIRKQFPEKELIIHISPGTPSMQTIWVLMAETGYIPPPFDVVKSYRKKDVHGKQIVSHVDIGIETFYKAYAAQKPFSSISESESVQWDPAQFKSPLLKSLYSEALRFAPLKVPLIILGERGTGKTTLAAWIRFNSPFQKIKNNKNWPVIACGQYTPETMRAELFGYKKGAFTGAVSDKKGFLSLADNDTLFLDEIGDISKNLQRLLIKALEEKAFIPLGSDKVEKSDFRLVVATNNPLHELSEKLDSDFLDRVSMLKLTIPPLREIPEDIPWMWEKVMLEAMVRAEVLLDAHLLTLKLNKKIVLKLQNHQLPGNLRDLFKIAFRVIAKLSGPGEKNIRDDDVVEYAFSDIDNVLIPNLSQSMSQDFAKYFTESKSIDKLIEASMPVSTKLVLKNFKSFLAKEFMNYSKRYQIDVSKICDVSDRTLREWKNRG